MHFLAFSSEVVRIVQSVALTGKPAMPTDAVVKSYCDRTGRGIAVATDDGAEYPIACFTFFRQSVGALPLGDVQEGTPIIIYPPWVHGTPDSRAKDWSTV